MLLSTSVLILNLFGCEAADPIEDGRHWYHDPPILASERLQPLKMGTVKWAFDPGSEYSDTKKMHFQIQAAAPMWYEPLGCGVNLVEVALEDQPDLIFRCEENENYNENRELEMILVEVANGKFQAIVKIEPERCRKAASRPFALHAVGHGLGFEEPSFGGREYPAIMNKSVSAHRVFDSEYLQSINGRELDALRIWSLEQGAPGCGAEDPLWSWEDPNLGYTYSAGPSPEMLQYIQELEARAKN